MKSILSYFLIITRSPDGSCLLTNSEDACLRLYNLPNELYQSSFVFNSNLEMVNFFDLRHTN